MHQRTMEGPETPVSAQLYVLSSVDRLNALHMHHSSGKLVSVSLGVVPSKGTAPKDGLTQNSLMRVHVGGCSSITSLFDVM